VADNVSSGIEPVFALAYNRKVLQPDGTRRTEEVVDYAVRLYREKFGQDAALPDYFVTAQDLTPADHVRMQAAVQRYVDSAISKTVNVPEDIAFEDFQAVYHDAYRSGCKGCTTYRPNAITGSVLEVSAPVAPPVPAVVPLALIQRGHKLAGSTYRVRWADSSYALYVTINDIEHDGVVRPLEMFVNSRNLEHYAWVVALTRMVSAVFRRGGDVSFIATELKQVFDPRGGQWSDGRYVPSLVAAIGDVIEQHMVSIGFIPAPDDLVPQVDGESTSVLPDAKPIGQLCPTCAHPGLIKQSGCLNCPHCGWSKCG
jgi:ribonucleoside-diphosphate reductase alpha chain